MSSQAFDMNEENSMQLQESNLKLETPMQTKIRKAKDACSTLVQIDKIEKEILSLEKKLSQKKNKLTELVTKL